MIPLACGVVECGDKRRLKANAVSIEGEEGLKWMVDVSMGGGWHGWQWSVVQNEGEHQQQILISSYLK
jgi:hypothetical protein